ncbi:MAG TPA: hypothetical protein ENI20_02525 [Bacteroides sp.]|nr:hypothetical protein [Bacteroides sp.]
MLKVGGNISGIRGIVRPGALLLLVSLFFMVRPVQSQNFTEVDKNTYELYMSGDWAALVQAGKSALKQDIDYYFLRMRIGVGYYEQKNYKSAQSHFKKALAFNAGDLVALEYLYYSYLFGGQAQQAALMYDKFSESMKEKLPDPGLKPVDGISVEYLNSSSNTDGLIADPATFEDLPTGYQIISSSYNNLNIGLSHFMHPGTSFKHAYTYLGKSNYYYSDDGINRIAIGDQKVRQHQYYLSPSFTTGGGLVISPSFHFVHVGFQIPYLTGGGIAYVDGTDNQMVGGLALAKFQGPFKIRLGAIYSNFNNADQVTGSAGLTWYPLGNLDVYLGASVNAHWEDLNKSGLSMIQDFIFGYGIASKVWIEISAAGGNMKNYTESNGYIVYNGLDWMRYKVLGTIMVPLTKKGSAIYAGLRYADYSSGMIPLDSSLSGEIINELNYNSTSFFGGLSWKF